jgi:radical SAM superfamily enzyme YgiQ (UPF0313 family)
MKIFLVNPIASHRQLGYLYRKLIAPIPPLGLCYLAAILRKNNFNVTVVDQYASKLSNDTLLGMIKESKPDVIGFSCLTPSINNIKSLTQKIRLLNKDIKIILGNLHASIFADELIKKDIADIVVHGEGEYVIAELISNLYHGKGISDIRGISYYDQGRVNHTAEREPLENLDGLELPARELLDLSCYNEAPMLGMTGLILPIQSSRGCNFDCIFCAQEKINKKLE